MIQTVDDKKRGCGWRKPGGLYLRSHGLGRTCGRMPRVLDVCPTCGAGIKPTRGWTWIDPIPLFHGNSCEYHGDQHELWGQAEPAIDPCEICAISDRHVRQMVRAGLLWIGERFYKSPAEWLKESEEQGTCRRIKAVPKDFELGKTWVFVAHLEAIIDFDEATMTEWRKPGIFHAFLPTSIEYVCKGDETEEDIEALEKRGITPVEVHCVDDGGKLLHRAHRTAYL